VLTCVKRLNALWKHCPHTLCLISSLLGSFTHSLHINILLYHYYHSQHINRSSFDRLFVTAKRASDPEALGIAHHFLSKLSPNYGGTPSSFLPSFFLPSSSSDLLSTGTELWLPLSSVYLLHDKEAPPRNLFLFSDGHCSCPDDVLHLVTFLSLPFSSSLLPSTHRVVCMFVCVYVCVCVCVDVYMYVCVEVRWVRTQTTRVCSPSALGVHVTDI